MESPTSSKFEDDKPVQGGTVRRFFKCSESCVNVNVEVSIEVSIEAGEVSKVKADVEAERKDHEAAPSNLSWEI